MNKLTEIQIKNTLKKSREKKETLIDGKGLELVILTTGGCYWRHRYIFDGKRCEFNLGTYPTLTLKKVREQHLLNRMDIDRGVNPKIVKNELIRKRKEKQTQTFQSLAERYFEEKLKKDTVEATWKKIIPYFKNDIFPTLGKKPISEITAVDIYEACMVISNRGAKDSAKRVMRKISDIYLWTTLLQITASNIAYGLAKQLPNEVKSNFKAVTKPEEFGEILKKIDGISNSNPQAKACLEILPLVFCRQGELRSMKWSDIDLVKSEWTYVISKTEKTNNKPHLVPLSKQVIKILETLKPYTGTATYVFASEGSVSGFISDTSLFNIMRASGITKEQTSLHGFRATVRTIADEVLDVNPDVLEIQLSHKNPKDMHGGAYTRSEFIQQRKDFMQKWSDYCDELKNRLI